MSNHLSTSQLWALAVGEVLLHANGYEHALEYDTERSGVDLEIMIPGLAKSWDISDGSTTRDRLESLTKNGHRKEFNELRSMVTVMTPEQQEHYISTLKDEYAATNVKVVQRYHRLLSRSGILAWDLGRAAFLCHACSEFGYIPKDEAWAFLMSNALTVQQAYSSWEEFGAAYIIGRQFWNKGINDEVVDHLRHISGPLSDPDSPWNRLPWDTELKA